MRGLAFELLERVEPSKLAGHMEPLLEVLRDTDGPATVREMAMKAVSLLPPSAVALHVQQVLQRMREPSVRGIESQADPAIATQMRETASKVLSRLELPVRATLIPELLPDLEDETWCRGAMLVLSHLPPAMLSGHIPEVLRALFYRRDLDLARTKCGLLILEQMDPSTLAEHTDEFQEALRHSDERVRRRSLEALGKFPLESIAAHAATLQDMLADPESSAVQKLAVEFLARLPAPALADGLVTFPALSRVCAGLLRALGDLPASATVAPPSALVQMLEDEAPSVRDWAIRALERLDRSALGAPVLLRMALGDSQSFVRTTAMRALSYLPAATLSQHVPELLQILEDSDGLARRPAAEALGKVDASLLAPHTAVLLSKALDPSQPSHVRAGGALGLQLVPPAGLIPHLAGLLNLLGKKVGLHTFAPDDRLERVVQRVVASMPADAFGQMLTVGGVGTERVLDAAFDRVIRHLPPETLRLHAPFLLSLLLDPSAGLRESALRMLCKLDPSELAKKHPALLVLGLLDPVAEVRKAALQTVCGLPAESLAPQAAEVLRMLWDSDELVREKAMEETKRMLDNFQAPALKEQLRRAAVNACIGDGVLGTLRRVAARSLEELSSRAP
jgi:HEAT repeat protein